MSSGQGSGMSEDEKLKGLLGAIGAVLFLAFAKYGPPFFFGLVVGLLIDLGARRIGPGWPRVRTYLLSLFFFACALFVAIGLPLRIVPEGASAVRFPGLLSFWDTFPKLIGDGVGFWNHSIGMILRGTRIRPEKWTEVTVSQYLWISFGGALFTLALRWGLKVLRLGDFRDPAYEEKPPAEVAQFFSFPAHVIWMTYFMGLKVWVEQARDDVMKHERGGIRSIGRAALGVLLFFGVAAAVDSYLIEKIPFYEWKWIATSFCFAPAVGLVLGLLWGVSQWVRNGFRQGFVQKTKKQADGFELGRDRRNRPYYLSERNLSYHIEIVASSGAGKTNLIKNLLLDRIERGHGVVFLDLKADFELVEWTLKVASHLGREQDLRLVSLADPEISVPYNPIASGSAAEIHSQLMNAWSWSNEYYRSVSSVALMTLLQGLCALRDQTGERFHLGHLYALLNEPGSLRAFAGQLSEQGLPCAREAEALAEKLDRPTERKELAGLIAHLNQVLYSAAGSLITRDVERGGSLDLGEATDQGLITYFLLNSLKLKESAQVLGKLVLQDLMRVVGDRYASGERGLRPVTLIVDEFGAFAIPEFIEFMDRARGAGVGIVIAHQSRADLAAVSSEFQKRIEANANTKIVGSLEDPADREYYAKILGTRTTQKETHQVESGFLGDTATGRKSVREVEEFIVHPNELVELSRGTVFTLSRTVDSQYGFVRVPLAPEVSPSARSENTERLKVIRDQQIGTQDSQYLKLPSTPHQPGENPRAASPEPGLKRNLRLPEVSPTVQPMIANEGQDSDPWA